MSTALSLSSNSPRNLAPAIKAPISRENIVLSFNPSGTSPLTILCAKPSATAVFPTPGSPINTGLFFVFLESILITFLISLSRPITGSSLPCFALCTRSKPYLFNASYVSSGLSPVTRLVFTLASSFSKFSFEISYWRKMSFNFPVGFAMHADIICSTEIYSSLFFLASFSASFKILSVSFET